MTPENFCYWLRGYIELAGSTTLTEEQVEVVSKHLDLVMNNVTEDGDSVPNLIEELEKNRRGPPTRTERQDRRLC